MGASSRSPLVEREAELAVCRAALAGAAQGDGRVLCVEGGAGAGKSAVLSELCALAADAGATVLRARDADLERDLPFGVLGALLRPALVAAAPDERDLLLAGTAAPVRALLGLDPDATRPVEPSAALLQSVFWIVDALCAAGPLVLCVDDVHWADAASLRALAYVAQRAQSLALVLAVGRRTDEPADDEAALTALARSAGDGRLPLRPLSPAGCVALVRARGAEAVQDAGALHAVTGGNALLVTQVADRASGRGERAAVARTTVAEIVRQRLDAAPPAARQVAQAVAVLGDGAPVPRLADYTGLGPAAVVDAAVTLDGLAVFAADAPRAFTHPLLAEAVLGELSANALGLAHLRAAAVLRAAGAPATQRAAHLLRSPPTGDPDAVADLRAAATAARARATPDAAVVFLRRALLEDPDRAGDALRVELGLAEQAAGAYEAAWEHLAPAIADPGVPGAVALAAAQARILHGGFVDGVDALAAAATARETVAPDDALGLRGAAAYFNWFLPAAVRREVTLPPADALAGDTSGERMALAGRLAMSVGPGAVAAPAVSMARAALADGRFAADSAVAMDCAAGPLLGLLFGEDLDTAERELAHIENTGRTQPWPGAIVVARFPLVLLLLLRGETAAAMAEAQALLGLREVLGDVLGPALAGYVGSLLLLGVLRHDGAEAAEAWLAEQGCGDALPPEAIFLMPARAHVRLALGRPQEALADALAWRGLIEAMGDPLHPIEFHTVEPLARLAAGDAVGAAQAAEQQLARARTWGAPGRISAHLRVLAQVAPQTGVERLEEALALVQDAPLRTEHAHALVELGMARRRAGQRAAARELLERGVQAATSVQARGLAERGVAELRILGARPRRRAFTGADALTPSERRVADLAASGATNREIAQHLFVTVKTIDSHLMRAYRKLGISSRRDLAGVLDG